MLILETPRLRLRRLTLDDAPFILRLVNEPSFHANIGDKGVRDLDGARGYLLNGPLASYEKNGFGLFCVETKEDGETIGMCGLLRRDTLPDVDVGFAFFPHTWGKGYATESALAVMQWGRETFALPRICAVVSPHNTASIAVLRKLGMRFERMVQLTPEEDPIQLFS